MGWARGSWRPVGSDRTCRDVPGFMAKPSSPACGVDRDARDESPDGHRQAQDSVRRRARNQVAAAKRCRYTKAGNVRSARHESGALQRARLAEAGCLLSVQVSARRDRRADQPPAKPPVNPWACGWQVVPTDPALSWRLDVRAAGTSGWLDGAQMDRGRACTAAALREAARMDTRHPELVGPLHHGTRSKAATAIVKEGSCRGRSRSYTGTGVCLSALKGPMTLHVCLQHVCRPHPVLPRAGFRLQRLRATLFGPACWDRIPKH